MLSRKVLVLGALIGLGLPTFALADNNLLINGGFETGDFTGWTQFGNTGFTGVIGPSTAPDGGNYMAYFGPIGSPGGISQDVATTPGTRYTVSFYLMNDGGTPSSYKADFGGNVLVSEVNPGLFGWTHFSYTVLAAANTSVTDLTFQQNPAYFYLDNVSVVQTTPEPGVYGVLALGLAGLIIAMRRREIA